MRQEDKFMSAQLYTIGHSNRPLDEFLALLARHAIQALVDIRRFPGSKKFPHFNQPELEAALKEAGIEYHWLEKLGGRRPKSESGPSRNLGLRNESFRNYADYMQTEEFEQGINELLKIAASERAGMMCAESLFWSCHRRLVSDFLVARGVVVQHIMPGGEIKSHTLTSGAVVKGQCVTYPGQQSLFA
jgi:uncharacterized protein (DUF488 family)